MTNAPFGLNVFPGINAVRVYMRGGGEAGTETRNKSNSMKYMCFHYIFLRQNLSKQTTLNFKSFETFPQTISKACSQEQAFLL